MANPEGINQYTHGAGAASEKAHETSKTSDHEDAYHAHKEAAAAIYAANGGHKNDPDVQHHLAEAMKHAPGGAYRGGAATSAHPAAGSEHAAHYDQGKAQASHEAQRASGSTMGLLGPRTKHVDSGGLRQRMADVRAKMNIPGRPGYDRTKGPRK